MFKIQRFYLKLLGLGLFSGASFAANLDCMVKPEMYVELSSPVAGTVEALLVDKGDHVTKGQAVAQLEASVELAKFNQAKADAETNSDLRNQKVKLEYASRNQTRYRSLFTTNVISQIEKDKVETEVVLAGIELKKAEERKKSAILALDLAKAQLEVKTIKSPIDGIVIDRYAMPGESVSDRAIMKLAQVNPLRVELIAPTEYFGLIQAGMEVEVRPELPAKTVVKATVTKVDQLIDPASGSFTIRMTLPNPSDELVGGVNCIASFDFATPSATKTPTPPPFAPQTAAPNPGPKP
ncbi:MAG: hypothetical protein BVN35_02770 [Proteobacteria bacterium ST_bin11]|nr:MAG: hypothetical protein BVN35_02770 [Proteobacteria bacterium ST_bin11]